MSLFANNPCTKLSEHTWFQVVSQWVINVFSDFKQIKDYTSVTRNTRNTPKTSNTRNQSNTSNTCHTKSTSNTRNAFNASDARNSSDANNSSNASNASKSGAFVSRLSRCFYWVWRYSEHLKGDKVFFCVHDGLHISFMTRNISIKYEWYVEVWWASWSI